MSVKQIEAANDKGLESLISCFKNLEMKERVKLLEYAKSLVEKEIGKLEKPAKPAKPAKKAIPKKGEEAVDQKIQVIVHDIPYELFVCADKKAHTCEHKMASGANKGVECGKPCNIQFMGSWYHGTATMKDGVMVPNAHVLAAINAAVKQAGKKNSQKKTKKTLVANKNESVEKSRNLLDKVLQHQRTIKIVFDRQYKIFWDKQTTFVFRKANPPVVIGWFDVESEQIEKLTSAMVHTCEENGWKYDKECVEHVEEDKVDKLRGLERDSDVEGDDDVEDDVEEDGIDDDDDVDDDDEENIEEDDE